MKKLAMILAVAFTMGLATSTVTAGTKDKAVKKDKTECAKSKTCTKDAKKACCSAKPAPAPAETPVPAK
jgi:hypothetical protein